MNIRVRILTRFCLFQFTHIKNYINYIGYILRMAFIFACIMREGIILRENNTSLKLI